MLLSLEVIVIDSIYDGQILFDVPMPTVSLGKIGNEIETIRRLGPFLASSKRLYEHVSSFGTSPLKSMDYQHALVCSTYNRELVSSTFIDYYHTCMELVAAICGTRGGGSSTLSALTERYGLGFSEYMSALLTANHAYFTATHRGRVGLAERAEPGDQVALLSGSRLPWVIRRHGVDKWTIVCPCYIEGVMHGELLQGNKAWISTCSKRWYFVEGHAEQRMVGHLDSGAFNVARYPNLALR